MKMQRFFASDMKNALANVRETFGDDAMIISNRSVGSGVEVIAAQEANTHSADVLSTISRSKAPIPPNENMWQTDPTLTAMQDELSSLRELLETQLSGLAWKDLKRREPSYVSSLQGLVDLGISLDISQTLASKVKHHSSESVAWYEVLGLLANQLQDNTEARIKEGEVVALFGATGVGKTTCMAKIAARYARKHGANSVKLVTTDVTRIAAYEQLSIYGKLLSMKVSKVENAMVLRHLVDRKEDKSLLLIDSPGISTPGSELDQHLALLSQSGLNIKRYLVLSSTSQALVNEALLSTYAACKFDGCIITKLDEAKLLGDVLSTVIKHDLPVVYLSDGPKIPDDLKLAERHSMVNCAVEMAESIENKVSEQSLATALSEVG